VVVLGHHPRGLTLEHDQPLDGGRDPGDDLSGAGAGADNRHPFAAQVVLGLPARGVELRPLKLVEAGPVRILRHVEQAERAHDDFEPQVLARRGVKPVGPPPPAARRLA